MSKLIPLARQRLFRSVPTRDLLRSLLVLRAAASPTLSSAGASIIKGAQHLQLAPHLVNPVVRRTVFEQFCGGESLEESLRAAQRLKEKGVGSILDYALEGCDDEEGFNETVRIVGEALERSEEGGFACIKPSAVGRKEFLGAIDGVMRRKDLRGFNASDVAHLRRNLSTEENNELTRVVERLNDLAEKARNSKKSLVIDAEEYNMCRTADMLSFTLQRRFNGQETLVKEARGPVVYMTFQMYLKDAARRWKEGSEASANEGFVLGVKAVRGAYLEYERREALANGQPSPVWDDVSDTHGAYDEAISQGIRRVARRKQALIVATHNEESLRQVAKAAQRANVSTGSPYLHIAQLYGMRDSLTLAAMNAGFNSLKYIPFGPLGKTLPYLIRRLEENRDLLGSAHNEIALLLDELGHRRIIPLSELKT